MPSIHSLVDLLGLAHPLTYLTLFLAASLLMVWRMEAMMEHGLEGTALGTLVMPYCSGLGNLVFVYLLLRDDGPAGELVVNSVVNNVTNLSLLLGLPALLWGLSLTPAASAARGRGAGRGRGRADTEQRLSRLSLLLTLAAAWFFTGGVWVLGNDGTLDRSDGFALIGLFLFWQCFQVVDVLKHNVRRNASFGPGFYLDLVALLLGAGVVYESLDWMVGRLTAAETGFFRAAHLGWLTGWLLVLPNALLALFYGWRRRGDVVYSSQIGDGHICIPLALGVFAVVRPIPLPALWSAAAVTIAATIAVHVLFVGFVGRLPRWAGGALVLAYAWFVYTGLAG